jgi:hypothetical protein
MITIDEIILPMKNINNLQGASILHALKHSHSLAMEPQSTQHAAQLASWILDAKYGKADLQSVVRDNCKHLSADQQKKLQQLLKRYCWVRRRYCLAGITMLGERVAKNTKLE